MIIVDVIEELVSFRGREEVLLLLGLNNRRELLLLHVLRYMREQVRVVLVLLIHLRRGLLVDHPVRGLEERRVAVHVGGGRSSNGGLTRLRWKGEQLTGAVLLLSLLLLLLVLFELLLLLLRRRLLIQWQMLVVMLMMRLFEAARFLVLVLLILDIACPVVRVQTVARVLNIHNIRLLLHHLLPCWLLTDPL
jgi:hypothetical protein